MTRVTTTHLALLFFKRVVAGNRDKEGAVDLAAGVGEELGWVVERALEHRCVGQLGERLRGARRRRARDGKDVVRSGSGGQKGVDNGTACGVAA